MYLDYWGASDIGCVRRRNEDQFLLDPELGLAIVADGIGGQFRGDVAATIACRVVREHLGRCRRDLEVYRVDPTLARRDLVKERLREALQLANSEVFRTGEAVSHGKGMGCTMEATLVLGDSAFLAHVGDARTYLVGPAGAHQLTEDHTIVQEKVRRGMLTPEQAAKAPGKNVITRAIGSLPSVKVDTLVIPFAVGNRLLLVSDGVTRYIGDDEIAMLCGRGGHVAVEQIVEIARSRGGVDNITAVMVAGDPEPPAQIAVTAVQLDELRGTALFETATARELRLVASVAERREAKAGRILFREGQRGTEVFLLVEGEVVVTRNGQHLDTVHPGGSFGEMALLDQPIRSATALVTEDSRLIAIGRHRFEQLLRQDDGVGARIMWGLLMRLSQVVRQQNERIATSLG